MFLSKFIATALVATGGFTPVTEIVKYSENVSPPRVLEATDLPKAKSTGAWLASAVRYLKEGDRLDGDMVRAMFDPGELTESEAEVSDLIDAVEFFEVKKPSRDKMRLLFHLREDENIKRRFTVDGEVTKVTLRDKRSQLIVKRLNGNKVECGIRGIGAFYGGKPIPERLMSFTVNKDELELFEVAGFDVESGYDLELPDALLED